MLKILGRVTSINVRKVLWALDELGLDFSREDWGLPLRDPKVPEFLALNPNGQVPVLVENGFVLWESNAILIYLAEREGQLLPRQLEARAQALQWLIWQTSELNPPWGYAVNALIRKTPGYDDPAKIADSMTRWGAKMDLLEAQLAKSETGFVAGEFSIADIALGLSVHRWMSIAADKPVLPAVAEYYERLKGREAGARWMGKETP
ncbi:MAG: glutathione S-transferase family protein [Alphaproteobacteria bacterium]|uniref:glutathione S-transferase family protein n=1 Tax=Devosia sp. XGJD_8 TaxID=3391187 RepID=UPI001D4B91CB|nr:glutathione S-transferase family protein [Alphaproteobacteria bacterium]MBU1560200.1 glutathione S-transferase family protein [Alphaproteobacteria bacterium]MBU2303793.1 glutathione S-transferase family protein [Alphaproteobacteria bacterium]MBU2369380.1 glutathione S-transferase family protein [Alphaproteobacteria bacterium]